MQILEKLKQLFSGDKKELKVNNVEEEKADVDKKIEKNNINVKNIKREKKKRPEMAPEKEMMIENAFRAKFRGDYKKALSTWNDFIEKYPESVPQARARKAKIYIIQDMTTEAKEELLAFIRWYTKENNIDYGSGYFTIFISALQDLGFINDSWPDKKDYIDNLSGKEIKLDKSLTIKRIKKGLKVLEKEDCWTKALEQIKQNMDLIKSL